MAPRPSAARRKRRIARSSAAGRWRRWRRTLRCGSSPSAASGPLSRTCPPPWWTFARPWNSCAALARRCCWSARRRISGSASGRVACSGGASSGWTRACATSPPRPPGTGGRGGAGLAAIAASVPGVGLYLPREGFCDATSCRPTVPDGRLGYVDNGPSTLRAHSPSSRREGGGREGAGRRGWVSVFCSSCCSRVVWLASSFHGRRLP